MANTSATGGYLAQAKTPQPLEDQELDRFLQQIVAGVTGMDGKKVFPRWQEEPPNLPDHNVTWASIGVVDTDPDTFPQVQHITDSDAPNGADYLLRNEVMDVMCSFYGPDSAKYCDILRDGIYIEQNRAVLTQNGMGLVECGRKQRAPQLIKLKWNTRWDITVRIRRQIQRRYPILNLVSAEGTVNLEVAEFDFAVSP